MHKVRHGLGAYADSDGDLVIYALGEDGAPQRCIGTFDEQHRQWLREIIEDYEDRVASG